MSRSAFELRRSATRGGEASLAGDVKSDQKRFRRRLQTDSGVGHFYSHMSPLTRGINLSSPPPPAKKKNNNPSEFICLHSCVKKDETPQKAGGLIFGNEERTEKNGPVHFR